MSVSTTDRVREFLEKNKDTFTEISDYVFDHPELRFVEHESAEYLAKACETAGFEVERGAGQIETAFVATYGSGSPVIGFLGEYDALSGLGQVPNETCAKP